jgi:polysaccharide deacetylase family protein (PEP-CTERM system associated)
LSTMASAEKPTILLTFDVEDWFQVENFKSSIPISAWDRCELRVWKNTLTLLDILDTAPGAPRATFFILGWVAQKLPALVRKIQEQGHEVASHGFGHGLCSTQSPDALASDLGQSKALLESITGTPVTGYRAPSFSITADALAAVNQAGYRYDASFNNFAANSRYGSLDLSGARSCDGVYRLGNGLFEVPVSNLQCGNRILPLGGGGYFRLFPFALFKRGMDRVLSREKAFVFYAHPWEFDPGQPRVHTAPAGFKFRHYINLARTRQKLRP